MFLKPEEALIASGDVLALYGALILSRAFNTYAAAASGHLILKKRVAIGLGTCHNLSFARLAAGKLGLIPCCWNEKSVINVLVYGLMGFSYTLLAMLLSLQEYEDCVQAVAAPPRHGSADNDRLEARPTRARRRRRPIVRSAGDGEFDLRAETEFAAAA